MSKQDQPASALGDKVHDRMGSALLTLAKHVWTLHDRQRMLEARLAAAGIEIDIDALPDTSLAKTLDDERDTFINDLLSALNDGEEIAG
jgi:hypothetical protein